MPTGWLLGLPAGWLAGWQARAAVDPPPARHANYCCWGGEGVEPPRHSWICGCKADGLVRGPYLRQWVVDLSTHDPNSIPGTVDPRHSSVTGVGTRASSRSSLPASPSSCSVLHCSLLPLLLYLLPLLPLPQTAHPAGSAPAATAAHLPRTVPSRRTRNFCRKALEGWVGSEMSTLVLAGRCGRALCCRRQYRQAA